MRAGIACKASAAVRLLSGMCLGSICAVDEIEWIAGSVVFRKSLRGDPNRANLVMLRSPCLKGATGARRASERLQEKSGAFCLKALSMHGLRAPQMTN